MLGITSAALIQITFIVPFIIALILINKTNKTIAITLSISASAGLILIQTFLIFSNKAGFHFQYFALIVVIFLVNDMHIPVQKTLAILFTSLSSIAFLLCDYYADAPYFIIFEPLNYELIRSFSLIVNLIAMLILLYIYSVQLSKKDQLMVYLACHDSLTNLYHRGHFCHLGEEFFNQHKKSKSPISLILLDIDDFQSINESYSHAGGDVALISLSNRIHSLLSTSAIFSRYGGEEFAILLPNVTEQEAWELAEIIRSSIEEMSIFYDDHIFEITISLGVIPMNERHTSFEEMIHQADHHLYNSKRSGKNKVTMMIK
jgi:diguanylate cyclase (GGDEF)-like protein